MKAYSSISIILFVVLLVSGCTLTPAENLPVETPATEIPVSAPTDTPAPEITPTPEVEYAAIINGEGIRLDSYEASLIQLTQALEEYPELIESGEMPEERVLESLIDRTLLAQAARNAGFTADVQMTVERLAKLIEQAGGNEAFETWLTANGYTLESFSFELPLEMEAAWQRDQIAAAVSEETEQVQARQILFYDPFQASRAYDQLQAGIPFETIAENNDPNDLGYLDWFPRGVLIFPELEEAAFSLPPGQYSKVIETDAGYHILYVIDKGTRPLSSEIRMLLEEEAVGAWLEEARSQAEVEVLVP